MWIALHRIQMLKYASSMGKRKRDFNSTTFTKKNISALFDEHCIYLYDSCYSYENLNLLLDTLNKYDYFMISDIEKTRIVSKEVINESNRDEISKSGINSVLIHTYNNKQIQWNPIVVRSRRKNISEDQGELPFTILQKHPQDNSDILKLKFENTDNDKSVDIVNKINICNFLGRNNLTIETDTVTFHLECDCD